MGRTFRKPTVEHDSWYAAGGLTHANFVLSSNIATINREEKHSSTDFAYEASSGNLPVQSLNWGNTKIDCWLRRPRGSVDSLASRASERWFL
ncbi:MAG: hypothetical protein WED04_08085 [Promethearchaeati archaeon SRVP18_Atabeyarchaeia-1]